MKRVWKRAAALVLALAMCMSLAGCYSADKAWAAKMGDDTMPIGGYIYYLSTAYSEAASKVDAETEIFKAQVDGQAAQTWVEDRALGYLRSYYYVSQKFDELGFTLSEEDLDSIQSSTDMLWSWYKQSYEDMGIAKTSFEKAYSLYNQKLTMLLPVMYGEGGELEIPEAERKDYYVNGYTYYQYFSVPLTKTDDEGNPVDLTDEEKTQDKEMLEDWAELVTNGRLTFEQAVENYENSHEGQEASVNEPVAVENDSLSDLFRDGLAPLKNGETAVIDATSRYYVVQKLDIEDDYAALIADESRTETLLREMKSEEFLNFTMEQGAGLGVEINQKAISSVRTTMLADAMGKNGTASTED